MEKMGRLFAAAGMGAASGAVALPRQRGLGRDKIWICVRLDRDKYSRAPIDRGRLKVSRGVTFDKGLLCEHFRVLLA